MKPKIPVQAIFREYFEAIAAAVFLALFLRLFVVSVLYLPEANMEPGLLKGDFVMSWKLAYGLRLPLGEGKKLNSKLPQRGDVVSFRFPGDEEQILVRRIIGLPGDVVQVQDGIVTLNGKVLEQTATQAQEANEHLPSGKIYGVRTETNFKFAPTTVPEESYFVLADNRQTTDDSRTWGFVSERHIESRLGVIWLSMDSTDGAFSPRWSRVFESVK